MAGCSKCVLLSEDEELLYDSSVDSEYVHSSDLDSSDHHFKKALEMNWSYALKGPKLHY